MKLLQLVNSTLNSDLIANENIQDTLGMTHDEMSDTFKKWNEGELDSFLIEISANILNYRDESGDILLEKIKDSAGQKGTGELMKLMD